MGGQAQDQLVSEVGGTGADDDRRGAAPWSLVPLSALAAGLLGALAGWVDHDVDGV